ncbi:DNA methyltransferase [Desulforamulus ruminis]|uniref:DNA methyltransferase n=1 Tax=Desulforamulus ruminis TaxID=1564 RepID=UPI0023555000|nr:DNA methyltransferase [Desulforamulus ruminis]
MSENNRIKRVKKYGIDLGERGIYDTRNKLNELTGKEWVYFTNSIWITGYSPTAKENVGLKYRKIHPSPKPPGLIKDIVNFFTKSNSKILDPFAGVGGTLLGTALAGGDRLAIGIELEQKYIDAYKKTCFVEQMEIMPIIADDSLNMLNYEIIRDNEFDLIIADPPYSDMMNKARTGQKAKLYGQKVGTPYSENKNDLGNLPKEQYLQKLREIVELASSRLKKDKYFILFCKDFQPDSNSPNILHADIIYSINGVGGLQYKGMRIWHDQAMSLYPFGYPYSFVMNQIHQYILIFRKG